MIDIFYIFSIFPWVLSKNIPSIYYHSSSNHMNQIINIKIYVFYTELHEILTNLVYEIPIMKREINKIEFYTQLRKKEFATKKTDKI